MSSTAPAQVVSVRPVRIDAPGRGDDLQVRVSAPTAGTELPVVVFSHGYGAFGASMDTYLPLVDYWTAHGFVVVQPNHLDAQGLRPEDPRTPDLWRIRIRDLTRVVEGLETIEAGVPGLIGRLDHNRVAVAGHSFGATSASALVGARVLGTDGSASESFTLERVKAAVLLALTGTGGEDLSSFARQNFPFMSPDFTQLRTPSMVVAGEDDDSPLTLRGPDWFTDGYRLAPNVTDLLTVFGAEHSLGGINGHHDTHTTDESPERVLLVQQATTAYLRTALAIDKDAWSTLRARLAAEAAPLGRIETK